MNEDLRRLVRLQEILLATEDLKIAIAALPAEIARLEKDQIATEKKLDVERAAVQSAQKERRKYEVELMGVETRISKYQTQINEVKTNKEYQAIQHEIEACRAERAALDEKILLEMDAGDTHTSAIRKVEDEIAAIRRATTEGKTRVETRRKEFQGREQTLEAERGALETQIGATYLDPFLRGVKQRKGLALVAVRGGLCGGCNVRVLPKLVQMVRRSTGLIPCDSCKRYLYVLDEPGKGVGAVAGGEAAADPETAAHAEGATDGDRSPAGDAPAQ